jgi:hypothetical protein
MYCNTLTLLQPHLISPRLKYSPLCPSAAQLRRYRDHMQYNTLAAQLTRDSSAPSLHLAISVSLLPVITALLASVQMSGLCAVCAVLPGTTAGRTHIHACLRQSLNNTSRHPLRKHYYYYRICHKTRHRYLCACPTAFTDGLAFIDQHSRQKSLITALEVRLH